jgi:DNA-binding transcriptional regulator YdaS (Cro superfamily)
MPILPPKAALKSAIILCGGQAGLARTLSAVTGKPVSQQRIWNAANRDRNVPAEWCLAIEQVTTGRVSRHELRPDLYPEKEK